MGQTPWSAVINLSNSIIGVSVLAMPWCFKECGVVLAISLLLITGFVNKFSCNLLLRSSKATRKTSYETLSNHTLGGMGKLAVEVSVILLLMCTCIAFFVIIGDLGPSLVSKFAGVENTSNLRTAILLGVAVFIILPLAQKRNVESLSALSTISICFYFFFATSVFIDSLPTLISLKWINTVEFWRPAGILKGMSIFALSMCCQPTLFAIYNSLQERTPKMMEDVVSKGVNLVAFVYMSIGFFGYITYYQEGIKGDILLNQPTSMVSDGLKLSFALSVALSFPLCVFPCRASIFSLLFPNADSNPITGMTYIPPTMFRVITVVILGITLTIAILVPNVEVVLSLTGSTMGSLACFILPALIYQHTVGVPARFMPKVLLIIGFCFMLVSTYDNIRPANQDHRIPAPVAVFDKLDKVQEKLDEAPVDRDGEKQDVGVNKAAENMGLQGDDVIKDKGKEVNVGDIMAVDKIGKDTGEEQPREKDKGGGDEKRQEPPIPHAPVEDDNKDKVVEGIVKGGEEKNEKADKEEVEVEIPVKKVEKEDEVEEAPKEKEKKIAEEGKEEEGEKEAAEIVDDGAVGKKESKEKEAVEEAEEKLKAQEEKQEKQEKKLEELQARQVIQERLIVKQAEELDQLRKEHEEEKQKDEALQNAAAQLVQAQAAQQVMGQVPQQPAVGGLQQPAGPGVAVQPVQPVAGGQQIVGQPVVGQVGDQQVLGQLGVQQPVQPLVQQPVQPLVQGAGQLPVGQAAGQLPVGQVGGQPVMGQPAGQLPLGQAAGQLPVAQQPVGQLPVAQQPVGQLPVGQDVGQLPVGQGAGQLPLGQAAVQPLPGQQLAGQGQQPLQGQLGQQQQMAAGQQVVQVGMQPLPKMVSMFPQGAGGMGQNLAVQQGGGGVGAQHAGVEGINPVAGIGGVLPQQQQQLQLMQGGVGQQGVLLDGMLPAGGGDGALGQANVMQQQQHFQANVAQQNPLALQQQQQQQQLLQQQQQQEQLVMQQQQVPVQQNQQQLPQQGVVGADGMAHAGFADMNQRQGDAVVVEGGVPQQQQHLEPADKMVKTLDKDAILEPGKDLNPAGVQQRVLNQAGAEGDKEGEKQKKKHKDEQKEGGKEGESDGVIQVVDEEKADGEEGMGGGNGDAVPAPVEKEGGAIGDHKKTGDKALIDTKNKKIEDTGEEDAEKGVDVEAKNEEEEEEEENGEKEPVDDGSETKEDQLQGAEDKLLENHLKMIENEEEEFADQENVGVVDVKDEQDADVAMVMKDADDEGKVEMNQEQKEHLEKKNIRSREEV